MCCSTIWVRTLTLSYVLEEAKDICLFPDAGDFVESCLKGISTTLFLLTLLEAAALTEGV